MRYHSHPRKYPGDWVEQGMCRDTDPNKFYPPDDKPVPRDFYAKAKAVCALCCVKVECLAYGQDEPYGVWGMTTPVERGRMRDLRIANQTMIENPLQQGTVGE